MRNEDSRKDDREEMSGWWNALDSENGATARGEGEHQPDDSDPFEEEEEPEYRHHGGRKRRAIAIAAIAIAAIAIAATTATAYMGTTAPVQDSGQAEQPEEPATTEEEAPAEKSTVTFELTVPGAPENTTQAEIAVVKTGDGSSTDPTAAPKTTVTPNEETELGEYGPGTYEVKVTALPKCDGCTFTAPMLPAKFTVAGDGAKVRTALTLTVEKAEKTPNADSSKEKAGSGEENAADSTDDSGKEKAENGKSEASTSDKTEASAEKSEPKASTKKEKAHVHTWEPVYKTVHHDAVYRTVHHDAVKKRVKVPTASGAGINGKDYKYEYKTVKEAYDEKVTVSKAYDEKVRTGWKCSSCGATR